MKAEKIGQNIKKNRIQKGYSQENLAEKAGINLRTLQRIEKGETVPRGDTLQRLAKALEVSPDELVEWQVVENTNALTILNLSSLCYMIFPLLGIIVPLILWISQKNQVKGLDSLGRKVLNFQITLNLISFLIFIVGIIAMVFKLNGMQHAIASSGLLTMILGNIIGNIYCLVIVLINAYRISKGQNVWYKPAILFLK